MAINQKQGPHLTNHLRSRISSFSADKEDLHRFYKILQERSAAAGEIEIQKIDRDKHSPETIEEAIKSIRESVELRLTVKGTVGDELYGSIEDVFSSPNFPSSVISIFVDSSHLLKAVHNYHPGNSFLVNLDFSKPTVFDFSLMPSQGTPNISNFEVRGLDSTWVNGVFTEIDNFIKQHGSKLSIVHAHSIYDILVWILGFPLAFRTCFLLSSKIENFIPESSFVTNAIYVYVFFAALFVFRILFHYLRWICPLVEYKSKRNQIIAHRIFFGTILIAIVKTYVVDFAFRFFK